MKRQDRKEAIVKAALPLFAKNGFATTTTKELAKAAGVSEALLYKHFPSKVSLYEEIKGFGSQGRDETMKRLCLMEPSTQTMVQLVCYMMLRFVGRRGEDAIGWDVRTRLFLHSCLEDGSFMRHMLENQLAEDIKRLELSTQAAYEAGDLVDRPPNNRVRLFFSHHMALMVAGMHLPRETVVDYGCKRKELVHEAILFALRGLGLTDQAIERYYDREFVEKKLKK